MSPYRHPDGHYAIHGPDENHGWVEFWSAKRLSFDNKRAWEKQLVDELAERLRLLAESGHHERGGHAWLRAVFASDDPIDCDAGNLAYDERCVAGSLEIATDSHLARRTLSGEILALRPVN